MNTAIAGHQNIIKTLEYSLKEKHSHAFLFSGAENLGKNTVADWFVEKILSDKSNSLENTFNLIRKENKLNISIEQVIELQKFILLKPTNNLPIIVRISEPEFFSDEAANRLLKILEEPPEYVIFILITHNEKSVLPTIKSRCEILHFNQVNSDVIRDYILDTRGVVPSNFDKILVFANGRPGRVIRALDDPDYFSNYINDLKSVLALLDSTTSEQSKLIQEWFSNKKPYIERKKKMEYTLSLLQELLHGIIAIQNSDQVPLVLDLDKISKKLSKKQIINLFDNLMKHNKQMAFNPDVQTIANHITFL